MDDVQVVLILLLVAYILGLVSGVSLTRPPPPRY